MSPYVLDELRGVLALPKVRARYRLTEDKWPSCSTPMVAKLRRSAGSWLSPRAGDLPEAGLPFRPKIFQLCQRRLKAEPTTLVSGRAPRHADGVRVGCRPVQMISPGPFLKLVLQIETAPR